MRLCDVRSSISFIVLALAALGCSSTGNDDVSGEPVLNSGTGGGGWYPGAGGTPGTGGAYVPPPYNAGGAYVPPPGAGGGTLGAGGSGTGGFTFGAGGDTFGAGGAGAGGDTFGAGGAGAGGDTFGAGGAGAGGDTFGVGGSGAGGAGAGGDTFGVGGSGAGGGPIVDPGGIIRGPDPTVQSATARGPYTVQTYTSGFRDGPAYADATIHYPTDATPPFAGVAVVPGFVSPQSSIQPWGPFLASHGIVTMTIGTNSGGDPPDVRARALLDALETLRSENTRAGSPLNGDMELSRLGVMGWSMGGGGALLAANTTPTLKAAISLCGWNPGYRYTADTVPSLMFAATNDPLAGGQSQGFYDSIPASTPKMLFEVQGGSHSIANNPTGLSGQIGRYGLSWMKVFLEGDERYRQFLQQQPTGTATFRSNL